MWGREEGATREEHKTCGAPSWSEHRVLLKKEKEMIIKLGKIRSLYFLPPFFCPDFPLFLRVTKFIDIKREGGGGGKLGIARLIGGSAHGSNRIGGAAQDMMMMMVMVMMMPPSF